MPSIEIACLDLTAPTEPSAMSVVVAFERGLRSHRSPSRFQVDFDGLTGSLFHLGNPQIRYRGDGRCFFAYELLSEACRDAAPPSFLEFHPAHVADVRKLMECLLGASPAGQLLFTSDWQFGPAWTRRFGPLDSLEFWRLHEARELLLNAAYPVVRSV